MNQSLETQLQVVQRSLGEVVLPALSDAAGHVIEQLHLSMATLSFIQQRARHARRYYRRTLVAYCEMAEAVVALLDGCTNANAEALAKLAADGRTLLLSPIAEDADYQWITRGLRASIATEVAAAQDGDYVVALDALVLERSGPILLQERVWCLPLGFELRPEDLPEPDWRATA